MTPGDTASHTPTFVGVAGATYTYMGLPLSAWVSIVTLTYVVLQIIVALPKAWAVVRRVFNRSPHVESIDESP